MIGKPPVNSLANCAASTASASQNDGAGWPGASGVAFRNAIASSSRARPCGVVCAWFAIACSSNPVAMPAPKFGKKFTSWTGVVASSFAITYSPSSW